MTEIIWRATPRHGHDRIGLCVYDADGETIVDARALAIHDVKTGPRGSHQRLTPGPKPETMRLIADFWRRKLIQILDRTPDECSPWRTAMIDELDRQARAIADEEIPF